MSPTSDEALLDRSMASLVRQAIRSYLTISEDPS